MLNKKLILTVILLISLLAISAVSANDNATDEVVGVEETVDSISVDDAQIIKQNDNEEIIDETDDGTFTALQNKINNASSGSTIILENDYVYDDGFDTEGIYMGWDHNLTIDGNGHTLDGLSKSRILKMEIVTNVTIKNIKFKNGYSDDGGGAIYIGTIADSELNLNLFNCEFENNAAKYGGAIYGSLSITSIAGAKISPTCIINKCNFINNQAEYSGGAIYDTSESDKNWFILNSNFNNNHANSYGGAIYSQILNLQVDNCSFNSNEAKDGGAINIDHSYMKKGSSSWAYYGGTNTIVSKCKFTNNKASFGGAVHWFADNGCLNSSEFNYNVASSHGHAIYWYGKNCIIADCICHVAEDGDDNIYVYSETTNVSDFVVIVDKINTTIASSAVSSFYKAGKYLVATLKDNKGNVISNVTLSINLNGIKTLTTDKNGQAKLSTASLVPNTYTAKITFAGNSKYNPVTKSVKVTVKKATPKITAKAKTFKKSVKTKKYTITLKDNLNKVMKNTKVTIKVNKKTYTAKTNSNGVATFKITQLTKKGKYTATVKYAGSKYYNAKSVKVKITVK